MKTKLPEPPVADPARADANALFVRRLLAEKQPEFAAALAAAERVLADLTAG